MRLRTRLLTSAAVAGTLVVPLVPGAPAGAAPAPPAPIGAALAWLETQQQPDGGFEVARFAGFETPDAVLAIAAAGQTDASWSTAEALAAVQSFTTEPGPGAAPKDPLDAIDDWVDSVQQDPDATAGDKGQQAAKVIALITEPLARAGGQDVGLDEDDFDPSGDTAQAVDLRAALAASAGDGSYPGLTSTGKAYAVWALAALGQNPPYRLFSAIAAGQQANGGFNFAGDPTATTFDPDITAVVVSAFATAGRTTSTSPTLRRAIVGLARQQRWDGEWAGEFDDGNPNSTAMVATAARTLGFDPDHPCWRDHAEHRLAGLPQPSPVDALIARQEQNGRFASPSDAFSVNTFATSQAVQGLAAAQGRWPYGTPRACPTSIPVGNRRTVHSLYIDLLVRLADADGASYWTRRLDAGLSPAQVAHSFTGGAEYAGRVVERLVQQHLGRSATPIETDTWDGLVTSGRRLDLIAALLATEEYYEASSWSGAPTDRTWAQAIYASITDRPASEDDVAYVLAQRDAKRTYAQIARSLLGTAEGRNVLVRDIYRQLLRREPLPADLTYWGGQVRNGVSPERLVTHISGSREYRDLTTA